MDGTLTCFNMLVEKRYPLIKEMLKKMLNWKLEAEAESTMAFELLKFIKSQFRGGLLGIMDFYNLVLLIQLDTAGDVPLDLSKDTKPYIKLRSSRSVHWDQQDSCIIKALRAAYFFSFHLGQIAPHLAPFIGDIESHILVTQQPNQTSLSVLLFCSLLISVGVQAALVDQ
ncbi:hypothetical protein Tco_0398345 [Tanacetum coccineum]